MTVGWFASADQHTLHDPINVVFRRNAKADDLDHFLRFTLPYAWTLTGGRSTRTYARIDEQSIGGAASWRQADLDLHCVHPSRGSWFLELGYPRFHIRIWTASMRDPDDGWWAIGSAHHEHYVPPISHVIHSWSTPLDFLEECIAGHPSVSAMARHPVSTPTWLQGHRFDGEALVIDLA